MRALHDYHPTVVLIYFAAVILPAMLGMNPILLSFSLIGALLYVSLRKDGGWKFHLGILFLFLVMALINPLVSHNGATVLFFFNQNPVTVEATVYGVVMAGAVAAMLYWFRSFTAIMTSDRLLCLFGILSPKLALTLSMALRYVPLFARQTRKVNRAQTAMGLYREDHILCRVRGGVRVFSVMLTWALENGIVTADSMAARGYGLGRRTHFTVHRFRCTDAMLMLMILALSALTVFSLSQGDFATAYYPTIKLASLGVRSVIAYLSYGILCLIPTILEGGENLKWKFLRSKI